jgi:hypothetical protein
MYEIVKVSEGIVLICQDCGHIEHVSQFDLNIGSQRMQAAQAMQSHVRDRHNASLLLKPLSKK